MSCVAVESICEDIPPVENHETKSDWQVRHQVGAILQAAHHRPVGTDARCDRREPFPYPIQVTPIRCDGSPKLEDTFVVLGKHLSERGLDFYYEAPVPYRRVIVSWESLDGQWLALLLDLQWCRSNKHGWYENGGRFLRVVESPLNPETYSHSVTEHDVAG